MQRLNRTAVLLLALAALLAQPVFASERNLAVTIPAADDLAATGEQARARSLPVLLVVSAEHCPYCVFVEENFIKPMIISGDYEERVLIRKLDLDAGGEPLRDFNGSAISASELAARYGVSVTPTLLYVDGEGRQLAPKMVGVTTPDFYGGYIDDSIETALGRLRNLASAAD